jgi:hypothetical protein
MLLRIQEERENLKEKLKFSSLSNFWIAYFLGMANFLTDLQQMIAVV